MNIFDLRKIYSGDICESNPLARSGSDLTLYLAFANPIFPLPSKNFIRNFLTPLQSLSQAFSSFKNS